MLLADDDRRYVDANAAACLLLRLPREEVLERRVDDLSSAEALQHIDKAWSSFIAAGHQAGTWQLCLPDGKTIAVDYSATANLAPGRHLSILIPKSIVRHDEAEMDNAGERREPLSKRERQVLTLIALGRTNDQIAGELVISPETVQKHVHNSKRKLGASTRAHAIVLALKTKQIGDDSV